MTTSRFGWSVAALAAVGLASAGPARADTKQECSAAYDETQALRDGGKLVQARRLALACSASTCSAFVVKDCVRWLAEIDASLPTVVFTAQDAAGADTQAARVWLDGQLVAERLDGKAVPLDPGEHVVRFEVAGAEAVTQRIVARQGEKNRGIALTAPKGKAAPGPALAGPAPAPPAPVPPGPQGPSARRVGAFMVGGVGVVGAAIGAVTGGLMLAKKATVSADCSSGAGGVSLCKSADDVAAGNSAKTLGLVSSVGWSTALAGLGVGAALLLTEPAPAKARQSGRVRAGVLSVSPSGAVLGLTGGW